VVEVVEVVGVAHGEVVARQLADGHRVVAALERGRLERDEVPAP
jgi:hypothetical protein